MTYVDLRLFLIIQWLKMYHKPSALHWTCICLIEYTRLFIDSIIHRSNSLIESLSLRRACSSAYGSPYQILEIPSYIFCRCLSSRVFDRP